ncbi:hydroxyacylglutathione hydrolase family protein [Natranaerofaba carboxydovora]|uniref:hydroxyacylglutathione hydrolase family protein n=1 Tax=Natranaerofaba carboxydovora TaxID=2742683 RepID=UPI001F146E44|nr:hydroxyacylglutathione hydrolase family protein [Natranaerofaba carboxydovora]UMZ73843.1 putative polyketide biosynthesis zinc-dependent hydrolase BaeB [Natranaerofaba carboxydovora]
MRIKQLNSPPPYKNFTYLVACEDSDKGAIIDPSMDYKTIINEVEKENININYIINTHDHPDHTVDNEELKEELGAKIVQHTASKRGDLKIGDEEELRLGETKLKFFHTPGHTDHDICIFVENNLFTGDTLFVGKVGGTSDEKSAKRQFDSLKKLMQLPDEVVVWPGHNNGAKSKSTIGEEKTNNPFCLRLNNFNEFVDLKDNWLDFKAKHGLE